MEGTSFCIAFYMGEDVQFLSVVLVDTLVKKRFCFVLDESGKF